MTKYQSILLLVASIIIAAGIVVVGNVTNYESTDNTQDIQATDEEVLSPVVVKTLEIYESQEFQEEMKTLATARAMFELAKDKQAEAIELSEQATIAYDKSRLMAGEWHNNIMYATSSNTSDTTEW